MKQERGHPLVGTWKQKANPYHVTAVVYTIAARQGRLVVSATDTADGEKLKISGIRWDGKELRFTSFCRSTNWKVEHEFRVRRPGLADHQLTYTEREVWEKQPESQPKSK